MKIKKVLVILCLMIILSIGCTRDDNNITFLAIIEDVSQNSMMVTTSDDVGFDRASVGYNKNMRLGFLPDVGQRVEITILPEIRESYPVQEAKAMMDGGNGTSRQKGYNTHLL